MTHSSPRLLHLLGFGLLGSALFSTSFVLYELMSVQGGHWFWSASLRCVFMWLLLTMMIWLKNQGKTDLLLALFDLFLQHTLFWCLTGTIGLGTYGWLAFGADFAPAWMITSTYLFTVVASLIVLYVFGQRFSVRVITYALVVFCGIVLANLGESLINNNTIHTTTKHSLSDMLLFGALPALIGAFCFPIGNQLIWQATNPHNSKKTQARLFMLPTIDSQLLKDPLHKVWLLTIGSLPAWLILGLFIQPPTPTPSQLSTTFLVALSAGVLGTSVFLYARGQATSPNHVAMIDATQASEIIFALIGGILLLGTPMPSIISLIGIAMVIIGLILFAKTA